MLLCEILRLRPSNTSLQPTLRWSCQCGLECIVVCMLFFSSYSISICGSGRTRTCDHYVNSVPLYQLSYGPKSAKAQRILLLCGFLFNRDSTLRTAFGVEGRICYRQISTPHVQKRRSHTHCQEGKVLQAIPIHK